MHGVNVNVSDTQYYNLRVMFEDHIRFYFQFNTIASGGRFYKSITVQVIRKESRLKTNFIHYLFIQ